MSPVPCLPVEPHLPILLLSLLWSLQPFCLLAMHFEFAVSFVCNTACPLPRASHVKYSVLREASPDHYPFFTVVIYSVFVCGGI